MNNIVPAATKTCLSRDTGDQRRRVVQHYRQWLRWAPRIQSDYLLDLTVPQIRSKLRQKFDENAHVRDTKTIDVLLLKGKAELEETMRIWKQKTHIMRWWTEEELAEDGRGRLAEANMSWLDRFYADKV